MNDVLDPGEVRIARRRYPVFPALVVAQALAAPIGDIERRISENEVSLEVGVAVVVEGIAVGDLAVNTADGQVHPRQPPSGIVRFLAVDRDVRPGLAAVAVALAVRPDELH